MKLENVHSHTRSRSQRDEHAPAAWVVHSRQWTGKIPHANSMHFKLKSRRRLQRGEHGKNAAASSARFSRAQSSLVALCLLRSPNCPAGIIWSEPLSLSVTMVAERCIIYLSSSICTHPLSAEEKRPSAKWPGAPLTGRLSVSEWVHPRSLSPPHLSPTSQSRMRTFRTFVAPRVS